ncbi:Putative uncharacterized protein, partial [Moritella viscosa]
MFLAGCGSGDPGDTSTKDISTEDKPAPIIYSTSSAFAALKKDGSVVTWGNDDLGGDSSAVAGELTDVSVIYSTDAAFAALKKDGSVVTWGSSWGGDSSAVAGELTDVSVIYSTDAAFAALK